jgi:hypothetical protein
MPKPICVVYYDQRVAASGKPLSPHKVAESLQDKMEDYHVFAFPKNSEEGELVEMKVFYDKDFTPIQYEELKQLIIDSLPDNKQ